MTTRNRKVTFDLKDIPLLKKFVQQLRPTTLEGYCSKGWFTLDEPEAVLSRFNELPQFESEDDMDEFVLSAFKPEGLRKFKKAFTRYKANGERTKFSLNTDSFERLQAFKTKLELSSYDEALDYLFTPEPWTSDVFELINNEYEIKSLPDEDKFKIWFKKQGFREQELLLEMMQSVAKSAYEKGLKLRKFNQEKFDESFEEIGLVAEMIDIKDQLD